MTAHKGHEYMICVAVWLPLTLYFIHRYAERLQITDLGYAAVPVALSILAGFPQITLYSTLLLVAYLFFCIAGSPLLLRGWKTKLAHIGFAAGVVLGIGVSLLIHVIFPRLPSSVPLWAVLLGVLVSMTVGLFFGIYPAVKAARLDPVDALRYE